MFQIHWLTQTDIILPNVDQRYATIIVKVASYAKLSIVCCANQNLPESWRICSRQLLRRLPGLDFHVDCGGRPSDVSTWKRRLGLPVFVCVTRFSYPGRCVCFKVLVCVFLVHFLSLF